MKAAKSEGFANMAKRIAACSPLEFRHATLVFKGGALVSFGYNHSYRHSEENALNKLWPSKRRGCVIYNVRIRVDGSLGISRPCKKCLVYLAKNGVSKVYYTTNDGRIVGEKIA